MKSRMLDSRIMKNADDRAEFMAHFSKENGIRISNEVILKQEIHGVYINGKLKGGFAFEALTTSDIHINPAASKRSYFSLRQSGASNAVLGVNYFWMSKSERNPLIVKYTWAVFLSAIFLKIRKFRYLAFSTRNKKIQSLCNKKGFALVSKSASNATYSVELTWMNFLRFIRYIFTNPRSSTHQT